MLVDLHDKDDLIVNEKIEKHLNELNKEECGTSSNSDLKSQDSDNCKQIGLEDSVSESIDDLPSRSTHEGFNENESAVTESQTYSHSSQVPPPSQMSSSSAQEITNIEYRTNAITTNMKSGELVSSIANALGGVLKNLPNETDVLKLGVGLGLSLSAKGILNIEEEGLGAKESCETTARAHSRTSSEEAVYSTIVETEDKPSFDEKTEEQSFSKGLVFPSIENICEADEIAYSDEKAEDNGEEEEEQVVNNDVSKNPVLPLRRKYNTHKVHNPDETITKFINNDDGQKQDDGLQSLSKQISPGFLEAINSTRVGSQHVDYIPSTPNLPQCNPVGRVKPRSAGKDWVAIGFDPWSAGKELLRVEFVPFLVVGSSSSEEEKNNHMIPLAAPKNAISLYLNRESKENEGFNKKFKQLSSYIRHGNYSEFELMLDEYDNSFPIDFADDVGNTLLMVSCQNGNKRMVKLCLRKGSDINKQNTNGNTSLHYAFGYGFSELGAYLISKGADDNITNAEGLTCYEGLRMEDLSL